MAHSGFWNQDMLSTVDGQRQKTAYLLSSKET